MGRFNGALLCTIACVVTMLGGQTAAPKAAWPPLPPDFAGDFTMDMATMRKLAGRGALRSLGAEGVAAALR